MARTHAIAVIFMVVFVAVAYAGDEDANNRKLLQSRTGASTKAQAATSQAIKQTVQQAQRGRGSTANTKSATRTGTIATTLIARPAGPATTTANAAVRATTPAPRTGRHLMQANRSNAGRSTASSNTVSASIRQAVKAANRGGSAPGSTQQATRTGQQAAQLIARPGGLPATTTGKIVTTRPAQTPPRGM